MRTGYFWLASSLLVTGIAVALPGQPSKAPKDTRKPAPTRVIDFNRDVRPILSEHCYKCHGPSARDVAANLRLDNPFSATKDMGGYHAIFPGDPSLSVALGRATTTVPDLQMPPPGSGKGRLSEKEVETLRLWIEQGAQYKRHWAFTPPQKHALPTVKNKAWSRNWIDRFVLAKLESEGLQPEPEADKATLIRRVSLTLLGLQPTPAQIDEFVNDKRPDAYARMVDRILENPHYGENQARFWLDAVRYGDTHGLHLDNERAVYPYRDWVVRAMNDNLSFDKFTLWQMAGDMLPNPTVDQRIATGYIRMNPTTSEGGAIEAEFLAKNTFDRVDTTGTVFLGLTVGCARCHDHKYDPISARDYFRMYAFFNSTKDEPLDGNALLHAPVMRAPSPEDNAKLAAYDKTIADLAKSVDVAAARKWADAAQIEPPKTGAFEVSGPYTAKTYEAAFNDAFGPEGNPNNASVTWKPLDLQLGVPKATVVGKDNTAVYVRTTITSHIKRATELRLGSDDGIKVWLNGTLVHQNASLRALSLDNDRVTVTLEPGENKLLIKVINQGGGDGVYLALGDQLAERVSNLAKSIASAGLTAENEASLRSLYLEAGPTTPTSEKYRTAFRERNALESALPMTLIAEELPKERPAFVLKRGEYNLPTDRVWRAVPSALGGLPPGAPRNRLGLAQWLINKQHPLTARVFVNRIWQQHFGVGLVKTAEDFGNQGEWPSNPELLDTMAVRFREGGWNIKDLHRAILNSAAFRQRSVISKEKYAKDPENRWVSRGPRFRLDAEVIRDKALFGAGTLNLKMGGPGFRPYQPAGLWEAIAFPSSNTANYVQDKTSEIYRRSLYLFWKRTSPHPIMLAFDAPMREACVVRRSRTNTPIQALVTMNETAFLEAARALGERVIKSKPTDDSRLAYAFRLTLGRTPNAKEAALLKSSAAKYRQRFAKDKASAIDVISVGDSKRDASLDPVEVASWTMIANTLLNTDEFLTQH